MNRRDITLKIDLSDVKPRLPMAPPCQVHQDRREKRKGGRRGDRDRAIRDGWE